LKACLIIHTVIISYSFEIFAVPLSPQILESYCDVENNSTSICVVWLKPQGGDAIDEYDVKLTSLVDPNNAREPMHEPHVRNKAMYNLTIDELQPGETVAVTVTAKNSAGIGQLSPSIVYTTSMWYN